VASMATTAARTPEGRGDLVYTEGLHVGYRGYGPGGPSSFAVPIFHFGHGLSYTSFRYSPLEVHLEMRETDAGGPWASVQVTLQNSGLRVGVEVVQLYVKLGGDADGGGLRALRGFHRTAPLKPGGQELVTFKLGPRALGGVFDPVTGTWRPPLRGSAVQLEVGASSCDIRAVESLVLQ